MTTFLLDVNVLLALSDPMHLHHDAAHQWFASRSTSIWATCPLTENGFVRIASHPSYPNRPGDAHQVITILQKLCHTDGHVFWPDTITIREFIPPTTFLTHNHVTDSYLLALAIQNSGKLATFDKRIALLKLAGAKEAIELIPTIG
jgi:uncharacterized protein